MSGWIFTIIGWMFSHTAATQLCSNSLYKWFLHNRSPLIYFNIHCPPKVWKRPRKVGFWTILAWILFNLWFCTDKGQHKLQKHILLHKQFIDRKNKIFDSSKYPPLAAITALHNLGIRAVSWFKHWLDTLLQASWRIAQRWFTLVGHFLRTSRSSSSHSSSIGLRSGDWGGHSMTDMMTVSSPNRICTAWNCAWGQAWKCAWKCDIVQNHTLPGVFPNFWRQWSSNVFFSCDGKVEFSASLPCIHPARASKWPEVIYFQCEQRAAAWCFLDGEGIEESWSKDYRNTKTVHSYTYEWENLQRAIWRDSPAI